jgi:hypothetical protein
MNDGSPLSSSLDLRCEDLRGCDRDERWVLRSILLNQAGLRRDKWGRVE